MLKYIEAAWLIGTALAFLLVVSVIRRCTSNEENLENVRFADYRMERAFSERWEVLFPGK